MEYGVIGVDRRGLAVIGEQLIGEWDRIVTVRPDIYRAPRAGCPMFARQPGHVSVEPQAVHHRLDWR